VIKIIKNEQLDPDQISTICNNRNNIIISTHSSEKDTIVEKPNCPGIYKISLPRDINLSSPNIAPISNNLLAFNYSPKIKVRLPIGVVLQFSDTYTDHKSDLFQKIYKSFEMDGVYDENEIMLYTILEDFRFLFYIDTIRMRSVTSQLMLQKFTNILEFYFAWVLQTEKELSMVEGVYIIHNDDFYTDFKNVV
jgi:hypothetical protein